MTDTGYQCRECGEPVVVMGEGDRTVIVRVCSCDAPIVAVMDARVTGTGSLAA